MSIIELARNFQGANKIVFFTGEGISREVGVMDIHTDLGPWGKERPASALTFKALQKDPVEFYLFCLKYLYKYRDINPGEAHWTISQLQNLYPKKEIKIITENTDGLHQKAGSKNVAELHGNLLKLTCPKCLEVYSSDYLDVQPGVPRCQCGKTLRPDMVLFYEDIPLDVFFEALEAIKKAELLIVAGSSLRIFPANTLIKEKKNETPLFIINNRPTEFDHRALLTIHRKAGPILRQILRHMNIKVVN